MGNTLLVIRNLLEEQIDSGETSSATDPSSTLLNNYINRSIRKIARKDKPKELLNTTGTTVAVTANSRTATYPSSLLTISTLYHKRANNIYTRINEMAINKLLFRAGSAFFDTSNVGDPNYFSVRGTSLVFDKYIKTTDSTGIIAFGVNAPTTLSSDSDVCDYPEDYDLLIVYEAAVLFYQKDDDYENMIKYQRLAKAERAELRLYLNNIPGEVIDLDPDTFNFPGRSISDPGVFFT